MFSEGKFNYEFEVLPGLPARSASRLAQSPGSLSLPARSVSRLAQSSIADMTCLIRV